MLPKFAFGTQVDHGDGLEMFIFEIMIPPLKEGPVTERSGTVSARSGIKRKGR